MQKIIHIGIDIDGVLRDFIGSLERVYDKIYPDKWRTQITEYDISKFFEIKEKIYDFAFKEQYFNIYSNAKPYPGALEFVDKIANLCKRITEAKFSYISYQPNSNIMNVTIDWLEKNGFYKYKEDNIYEGTIFTENK